MTKPTFCLIVLTFTTCVAGKLADIRQFQQFTNLEQSSETSANASVGDLDGDGDLDIVLAKGRHWQLHDRVLLNNGTGNFSQAKNLGSEPDLNGDTYLDIVVGRSDAPNTAYFNVK